MKRKVLSLDQFLLQTMGKILSRRMNGETVPPDSLRIVPFSGYGTETRLRFRGRVVEKGGIVRMDHRDLFIHNAHKMWKRFYSRPGRGVLVRASTDSADQLVSTTEQGFFHVDLNLDRPLRNGDMYRVNVEVVDPKTQTPVRASGPVFMPPKGARIGFISDIDDTIVYTHVANPLKMIRLLLFSNAATRLPFPGVRAFYSALHDGRTGGERNPFFYISSSSWQMYDILQDFLSIHAMPQGPIFLRELPCTGSRKDPWRHGHKLKRVKEILESYPDLPFVLIGDSGQRDAELYSLIVRSFPGRIPALYIRDVLPTPLRRNKIKEIAAKVREAGSELLLIEDTMAAARDGVARGWIPREHLSEIERDRAEDVKRNSPSRRSLFHILQYKGGGAYAGSFDGPGPGAHSGTGP